MCDRKATIDLKQWLLIVIDMIGLEGTKMDRGMNWDETSYYIYGTGVIFPQHSFPEPKVKLDDFSWSRDPHPMFNVHLYMINNLIEAKFLIFYYKLFTEVYLSLFNQKFKLFKF